MIYRRLSKTELKVSALGLGCGRLGSVTQANGSQAAMRLVKTALDAGINFFDTADIYGQGASETLLGKALRGRTDVVIATKAGFCLSSLGWMAKHLKPMLRRVIKLRPGLASSVQKVRATQQKQDFSAEYLQRCIEGSLRRLGRQALDVFYLHSPPTEVLQRGEVFEMLQKLKSQGKVRHYGVSCRTATDAKLCLEQQEVEVLQVELNPLTPETIEEILPAGRSRDVAIVARQALAGGLLLRPASNLQTDDCIGRERDFERAKSCLRTLETLGDEIGENRLRLVLRFVLGLEGVCSVLTGTTRIDHLEEQLAAVESPALGADFSARLRECALPAASARAENAV